MSDERFTTDYSDLLKNTKTFIKMDNERLTYEEVVDLLNEQQATINKLKKARDESDKFIIKKGLEAEFLNWVVENDE